MTKPYTLHRGDCIAVMRGMADNSVDAVVTDPPYGISFMGKAWDGADIVARTDRRRSFASHAPDAGPNGGHKSIAAEAGKYDLTPAAMRAFQDFSEEWAREAFRVLKPGGHLLSFSSARTYHRMTSGIEDAGFEIRDQIMWVFGSGFPKSQNVSKALDKKAGAERAVLSEGKAVKRMIPGADQDATGSWIKDNGREYVPQVTAPATDAAQQWDGWGTALKPAHEPICVARKPLAKGHTVAANVLAFGTGAINVDGCRVETADNLNGGTYSPGGKAAPMPGDERTGAALGMFAPGARPATDFVQPEGRWPANLIHDGSAEVVALFPAQAGASAPVRGTEASAASVGRVTGERERVAGAFHGDTGSAARFFYSPQPEELCNANTAEDHSTLLSQVDDFAQSLAAIAALHAGKPLSFTIRLFMSEIASVSRNSGAISTQQIQSIEKKCLPELPLTNMPATIDDHAKLAELFALTATTTIMRSLLNIVGSAEAATLSIIATILGHGARVCDPSLNKRFMYCAKASRADRNAGLVDPGPQFEHGATLRKIEDAPKTGNIHPTVKPTDLMRYLCRLVTPPGGVVLDPFMGSGSTGKAAMREGFQFIGIDLSEEYFPIAQARIEHELACVVAAQAAAAVAAAPAPQLALF